MNTTYFCIPFAIVGGKYIYGSLSSFKTENIVSVTEGDFVDMGAGILWASANLGAKKPTEAGDRYAWGELTPKESYLRDNYSYYLGGDYIDIGNSIVNTDYDVCRNKLGEGYRLPLVSELNHLFTDNSYAWTEYDGVLGVVIQSDKNGNSIFIPYVNTNSYSGYHKSEDSADGYTAHYSGKFAGFMTGELSTKTETFGEVNCLMICPEISSAPSNFKYNQVWYNGFLSRELGQSVRAVHDADIFFTEPEVVDLGLSVKWATCNLGANSPEDAGYYFAWGETSPKSSYTWDNYSWGTQNSITKYTSRDGIKTLEHDDDAAHEQLGGYWRMPTQAELRELANEAWDESQQKYVSVDNCSWEWTVINGMAGCKVTSKKVGYEGNSIFIPASGHMNGMDLKDYNSVGYLWTASKKDMDKNASSLLFSINRIPGPGLWLSDERYHGKSIRPVYAE
jgi:hypothetical protein